MSIKRLWLRFLYGMQETLSCSKREAVVLLSLMGLYSAGLLIRYVDITGSPYDDAFYAADDSVFAALSSMDLDEDAAVSVSDVIADTLDEPPEFPLDLNSASRSELQHLPRIGPALSERIITYREQNGPFLFVEDLTLVSGIGEKTLEGLLPLVEIAPDDSLDSER